MLGRILDTSVSTREVGPTPLHCGTGTAGRAIQNSLKRTRGRIPFFKFVGGGLAGSPIFRDPSSGAVCRGSLQFTLRDILSGASKKQTVTATSDSTGYEALTSGWRGKDFTRWRSDSPAGRNHLETVYHLFKADRHCQTFTLSS